MQQNQREIDKALSSYTGDHYLEGRTMHYSFYCRESLLAWDQVGIGNVFLSPEGRLAYKSSDDKWHFLGVPGTFSPVSEKVRVLIDFEKTIEIEGV